MFSDLKVNHFVVKKTDHTKINLKIFFFLFEINFRERVGVKGWEREPLPQSISCVALRILMYRWFLHELIALLEVVNPMH